MRALRVLGLLSGGVAAAALPLCAQFATVSGRVIDAHTGLPVVGAQVTLLGRDGAATTGPGGSYALADVARGPQTLAVRRGGFRDERRAVIVPFGEAATVDFSLSRIPLHLDESVAAGLPRPTRLRAVGHTTTSVDVEDLSHDAAITSVRDVLTGRVAGLRFTRLSGDIGTGAPMILRGIGSFDLARTQPLVLVDGVRVDSDPLAGPPVASGPGVSALDDLDPRDIESIEILRGPAATSLYGTEGGSGVISIRTKRGLEGPPQLTVGYRRGANFVPDPRGRLGTQWMCPTAPSPGPECTAEADLLQYNMYEEASRYIAQGYFPWPTEDLYQNGLSESYDVAVRGGTPKIAYYLSASYSDEEGAVWYNTDEAFRLRANIDVALGERFRVDVGTAYVDGKTRFMAPVNEEGGLWQDLVWSNGHFLDRVSSAFGGSRDPRLAGFQEHLPSDVADVESTRSYARFLGSMSVRHDGPTFELGEASVSLESRLIAGIDKRWDVNQNLFPLHADPVPPRLQSLAATWRPVYSETVDGTMSLERPIDTSLTLDYVGTAEVAVGDTWSFATSVGIQYYRDEHERFANSGSGFASALSRTISQIAQANIETTFSLVDNTSLGVYVHEQVGWNDRVFVSGGLRRDDSSTFGAEAPAETYPSLSASWVVSEEPFWGVAAVDRLRVRGAWGKAGRRPAALANLPAFGATPGPAGSQALTPTAPGNTEVGPEVSSELEVGFDAALLDDRVWGSFTRYWKSHEVVLLRVPFPVSTGLPGSVEQNVGRVRGWGWEAALGARLYEGRVVVVDLDVGVSHSRNEVRALETRSGSPGIALRLPWPAQWTDDYVVSARFDPLGDRTNVFDAAVSGVCDEGVSLAPDLSALDADRYGRVRGGAARPCADIPDQGLYVGTAYPTRTFSVAPRVQLLRGRLHLFALAEGQHGQWRRANDKQWAHIRNNSRVSRLEDDPLWVYADLAGDDTKTVLYDADFWKLREVGARVSLPRSWIARTGADRAYVALSARNVWTIWRAQAELFGLPLTDPELGTPTLDGNGNFWETPPTASVHLSLRVTL